MSEKNKAIVGRWFTEFWGNPWNPAVIDEIAARTSASNTRCMRPSAAARP
jgi:hypothetical protein